jgi:predicted AAA+ superfamily ATPase
MRQLAAKSALNFDDVRLAALEPPAFELPDAVVAASGARSLYFDEPQTVPGWERYVRQKLDEGFRVTVTGSNASLLSRELGTHLTGRHLARTLPPFSHREFLAFAEKRPGRESFGEYLDTGGSRPSSPPATRPSCRIC